MLTKPNMSIGEIHLEGWRRLRLVVAIEGATLLSLVLIAAPLKRLADLPIATQIMGPVHGLAFLCLLYLVTEGLAARMINGPKAVRLLVGAMIPFGGIFNERWLARIAGHRRPEL